MRLTWAGKPVRSGIQERILMLTFVVFVVVFGGMIFVHEFGHFIVARFFKIPIEEFGFGIPPRAFRLWRAKGHIVIGGQSVIIPANFDLPFGWQDGLYEEANATADEIDNNGLVLRSIELLRTEKMLAASQPAVENKGDLGLKSEYEPSTPPKAAKETARGAIALKGVISEVETGTELTINWLPLGGFVRPRGENDPDVPGGLAAINPWKRLAVLVAGPFMNLLTAVVVFAIIITQAGISVPGTIKIEEVTPNSPAEKAGLKMNDIIRSINGTSVSDIEATRTLIRASLDKPIQLLIDRNGQQLTISATPLSKRPASQGALGVALGYPTRPASFTEAITGSFTVTGAEALALLYLPVGLIQGTIAPDEARFVGLKGIYDFFGSAIERDTKSRATVPAVPATGNGQPANGAPASGGQQPTNYLLALIATLSVTLGTFNLLPIPALDGGRILFTLPEILFRRRIPTRFENTVNSVAFLLLIGLMLVVNVMDFINPVNINLP
jgi:regulator of sigma E protease